MDWQRWVGRSSTTEDRVTSGLIRRFWATIDGPSTAGPAPQGLHWCLCLPDVSTALLGSDGHPIRLDADDSFLPPIPLPRRMWASSKTNFLAPISRDADIQRVSTIAAITEKSGNSGTLVFVEIDHVTRAEGSVCVEERQTIVYREANMAPPAPRPADVAFDPSGWDANQTIIPSEALLFRYSALTFNAHRIHYDLPYATHEEGYRGLVVHGPLTATLLLNLAAQAVGAGAVRHFAFKGQSPAFAGEPLHLALRRDMDRLELRAIGGDGRILMSADATVHFSN